MCSVSLRPEFCRSIGEVEVPMLNVALTHHPAASQFWDSYTDWATQMQTRTACRVLAPDQPLTYQTSCLWPCLALTYAATKYVMHISTCIFMDPGKCLTEKSKCFVQSLLAHV